MGLKQYFPYSRIGNRNLWAPSSIQMNLMDVVIEQNLVGPLENLLTPLPSGSTTGGVHPVMFSVKNVHLIFSDLHKQAGTTPSKVLVIQVSVNFPEHHE